MLFTRDAAKEIVRGTQRFPVAAAAARALFIFPSMTFFLFGDSPPSDPAAGLAKRVNLNAQLSFHCSALFEETTPRSGHCSARGGRKRAVINSFE